MFQKENGRDFYPTIYISILLVIAGAVLYLFNYAISYGH